MRFSRGMVSCMGLMLRGALLAMFFYLAPLRADDDFRLLESDSPSMLAAFHKAREGLPGFLRLVEQGRNRDAIYGAYVRVEEQGNIEYLWVSDVQKYDDKYYMGVVIVKPRLVGNVKEGTTIGFTVEQIYDWQYYDKVKGIMHGGYTICALSDPESEEDREYLRQGGFQCAF